MQKHKIIIPKDDGGLEVYPMKQWLRDHPEHLPTGVEVTTSTSHQLRNLLRKQGWVMKEAPHEILLIPPDTDPAAIDSIVEDSPADEDADAGSDAVAFSLEYQLRDFIAANLNAIPVAGKSLQLYVDPHWA